MTPREKARELVDKFIQYSDGVPDDYDWQDPVEYSADKEFSSAKQCALIAVDEIIKEVTPKVQLYTYQLDFWQQVKNEIEQL